jgi:5'-nucleotidase
LENFSGEQGRMKILLSNDDGIYAEGLRALHRRFSDIFSAVVVAPDQERSAISHAITLEMPIRSRKISLNNGDKAYAVSGTPADCIKLAMIELLEERPDLMISGINPGANAGIHINYSGTFAAAREAAFYGIPAMAVSIMGKTPGYYDQAAEFTKNLAKRVMAQGLPEGTLLNVNIPDLPMQRIRGVRISNQNIEPFREQMEKRLDPRERPYYWHGIAAQGPVGDSGSDVAALSKDYISITPIKCDMTDYQSIRTLKSWDICVR